jgi:hypothetical protein
MAGTLSLRTSAGSPASARVTESVSLESEASDASAGTPPSAAGGTPVAGVTVGKGASAASPAWREGLDGPITSPPHAPAAQESTTIAMRQMDPVRCCTQQAFGSAGASLYKKVVIYITIVKMKSVVEGRTGGPTCRPGCSGRNSRRPG